jgi:outer membrane protein
MSRTWCLRLFAVCVGLISLARIGAAQNKVAVLNVQRAVLDSADIQKASATLEAKYKPRTVEIEKLQREIQSIQQQLQAGQGTLSTQAQADLTAQGQRKQREVQRSTEDLQADVERERNDILAKATGRMHEVVQKLADERGLDMVVDTTVVLVYKPALDITADALAAYNKAYPAK